MDLRWHGMQDLQGMQGTMRYIQDMPNKKYMQPLRLVGPGPKKVALEEFMHRGCYPWMFRTSRVFKKCLNLA
jgi:hypothetical protein